VEAAAAGLFPRERVCAWRDELRELLGGIDSLLPEARAAVQVVLTSFLEEDACQPEDAAELRAAMRALEATLA
jgi:hypothetical protein